MTSLVGEHLPSCYTLAEHISDGFAIVTSEGRLTHANHVLESTLGFSKGELENRVLHSILHEQSKDFRIASAALEPQDAVLKSKVGTGVLVDIKSGGIFDNGKADGFYILVRPILRHEKEQQLRYHALFENTNDAIFFLSTEGNILDCNSRALEMLGYEKEELLGKSYVYTINPADVSDSSTRLKTLLAGNTLPVYEREFRRKDGSFLPVEMNVALVRDRDANPLYIQSIVRDISERKAAQQTLIKSERALRQSEEKFRTTFYRAGIPMVITNLKEEIVEANAAMLDLLGYSEQELRDLGVAGISHPEDHERDRALAKAIALGERDSFEMEKRYIAKNGQEIWGRLNVSCSKNEEGEPDLIVGMVQDISEHKKTLDALKASVFTLKMLFDKSPIGMEYFSSDGELRDANQATLDIAGVSKLEDILGFNLFEDPNLPDEIKEKIKKGESVTHEIEFSFDRVTEYGLYHTSKTGIIYLEAIITPLDIGEDGSPRGYLSQLIDITERMQAQRRLRNSEERYRTLVEASPDAILMSDQNGTITMANRVAVALTGHQSRQDLLGKHLLDLILDTEREKATQLLADTPTISEEPQRAVQFSIVKQDGEIVPAEINATGIQSGEKDHYCHVVIARNISERFVARRALEESQERLELALSGATLGVWDWDAENDVFFFDERYARILGYDLDEIDGKDYASWESLVHADDLPDLEAKWNDHVYERSETYASEHRLRTKSGDYKWVLESGKVQERNEKGGTKRATGTIMDITARKNMEAALKESEARYRSLVETSPNAVVMTDLNGTILFANDVARGMILDMGESDIVNRNVFNFVSEKERSRAKELFEDIIPNPDPSLAVKLELIGPENEAFIAEILGNLVTDSNGEPTNIVLVIRDITEQLEAERVLRQSEEKYRALSERSLQGLVIFQDNGIKYANQAYAEITGYSTEELQEFGLKNVWDMIHPDDKERLKARYQDYMKEKLGSPRTEYRILRKNGDIRWVESYVSVVDYEGASAMQAALVDITDRVDATQALQWERDRAQMYLDIAGTFIMALDEEGEVALINRRGCELLELPLEDAIGRSWFDFIPETDRGAVIENFKRLISGEIEGIEFIERPLVTSSGKTRVMAWHTTPLFDEEGRISGIITSGDDITALHKSEQRLREIVANLPVGAALVDNSGKFTLVNNQLQEILGYQEGELLGRSILDLSSPEESMIQLDEALRQARKEPASYEHTMLRKDGIQRDINITAVPWSETEAQPTGVLAVMTDVTELKAARVELERSEMRLRTLVDSLHDLVFVFDSNNCYSEYYSGSDNLLVMPEKQFLGKSVREVLPTAIANEFVSHLQQVRETGGFTSFDYPLELEGETKWFSAYLSQHEDGTSIVSVVRDVTARIVAEQNVRMERQAFRIIAESAIYAKDTMDLCKRALSGLLDNLEFDRGTCRLYDSSSNQLRIAAVAGLQSALLAQDLVVDEDTAKEVLVSRISLDKQPVFTADIEEDDELSSYTPRLRSLNIRALAAWPLLDEKGGLLGILSMAASEPREMDSESISFFETVAVMFARILERQISQEEVRRLNDQLSQLVEERTAELAAVNKELEAFAYTVSHDLRAPLRTMDGFSQAILEDYGDRLDEKGKDFLNRIRQAANRMSKLIEDILALSRVTRSEMERTPVNLSLMAEEIVIELQQSEPKREVEVIIDDSLKGRCDRRLIRAVLQNLIGNAWKFTSEKEIAKIEFGAMDQEGERVFFVRDNGVGFDMQYSERLFKPFQRLHGSTEFEGSGIGLATAERAIVRHGGRIWAEGGVGQGATFYFTFSE